MIEIQMPRELECTRQVPGGDPTPSRESFSANDFVHDIYYDGNLDTSVLSSLNQLMKLYKLRLGDDSGARIFSGGIQQLLNKNPELAKYVVDKQPKSDGQKTTFDFLPVSVKLHIFSFLGAKDLCRSATVSQDWCCLTGDQVLWQKRLRCDVQKWDTISHMTNPAIYKEVDSEWTNKEIYLRCSPESNSYFKKGNFYIPNLPSIFKSLIWPYTPRVTLFGPALDSKVHHLMGKMMYDTRGVIKLIGLVHGATPGGLGGGVTLQISNRQLHLSPLYSGTKSARENVNNNQRLQNNLLLNHRHGDDVEGGEQQEEYELKSSIQQLCSTNVDAFVYAVNADEGNTSLSHDRRELFAMLNEKWSAPHIPVLVLACVNNSNKRIPCVDIVNQLKLGKLNRPWQVVSCDTEILSGVSEGFTWLLNQVQRH